MYGTERQKVRKKMIETGVSKFLSKVFRLCNQDRFKSDNASKPAR
jgi:hypothetical protein